MSVVGDDTSSDAIQRVFPLPAPNGVGYAVHSSAVTAAAIELALLRINATAHADRDFEYSTGVRVAFCLMVGAIAISLILSVAGAIWGAWLQGVGAGLMGVGAIAAVIWIELAKRQRRKAN